MKAKEALLKFFYFFMVAFYFMGTIGGIGYAIYGGSWPIAIAIVGLAYMAWPKFREYWQDMLL